MRYLLFALFLHCCAFTSAQELTVMTFNLRYDTPSDSLNAWPYRKDHVAQQILFHNVQLLGVQEALHRQMQDLKQRLPGFAYVGVGRDDGKMKGEYSAIFYDSLRFRVKQSGVFWLSQTPEKPGSLGWDAQITRIVTWAQMKDLRSKTSFFVFNTHFDHMGKQARRESALLLKQKVQEIAGGAKVILMGDFNATAEDEPIQLLKADGFFTDTKAVSRMPHYGPEGTFNGFKSNEIIPLAIDHIFIKGGMTVLRHATLSQTWMGRFASDHFSVMAVLNLFQ